jgi:hypothetical protein
MNAKIKQVNERELEEALSKMPEPEQSESRALIQRHIERLDALEKNPSLVRG